MISYLNKLSRIELKKLERFVRSEYFNVNRKVTLLFDYLMSLHPDITEADLTHKAVSAVVGERKMSPLNYRKLLSDLTKLLERSLIQAEIDEDSHLNDALLLKALRKRAVTKRFDRNFNEIAGRSDNEVSKDGEYYLQRAKIYSEKFYFDYGEKKFEYSPLLQEMSNNIDLFFVFEKLHFFNQMLYNSIDISSKGNYSRDWYEEVMNYVLKHENELRSSHPNIYIIYLTVRMFENDDEVALRQLLHYLKDIAKSFPKDKLSYYYNYVTSFCLNKVNRGVSGYTRIALDLYKKMNELDLLVIDGYILDIEFNNAVNLALSEGEVSWADKFIENNKNKIDLRYAKDAYHLAKAKIHFYRKDYDKMFRLMEDVEYKDPYYYINGKVLLGRAYIDIGDYIFAKYVYDNLNQYKRVGTGLTDAQRNSIRRFLKYFGGLIKLGDPERKKKKVLKEQLLAQLRNEKNYVPTKVWLEEKLSAELNV